MTRHQFALFMALSGLCRTAVSADSPVDRHPCASVADDAARLACYDAAFGRPASAVAPVPAVPPAAQARREFGLTEHARDALRGKQQGIASEPKSLTATVAEVGHRPTGEMIVTLDDGQVWVELGASSGVVVKPGDTVTIRKAALGSHMLVTSRHVGTRVRRVK